VAAVSAGEPAGGLTRPLLERLRGAVSATEPVARETPVDTSQPSSLDAEGRRPASVLLLFDPDTPSLPLLFMLRSAALRYHAGQIGFPGGGREAGDGDVVATALREAREEVGLDPDNVEVIGLLPPFATAVSDRWLTPVVALQRAPWTVVPDTIEVADWFRVDLTALLEAPHEVRRMERNGASRAVHFYQVGERVIWGVTGAILHELMRRLGRLD
jgi:8-oxo-dGTP pyrophosphatase MutT (NUDIX family)